MARKPDTPCAGGCGKLLWGGSSSLPAGLRMCRACRTHRPLREFACVVCGAAIATREAGRKMCSAACRDAARRGRRRERQCEICEAAYRATYSNQRTCGRPCGEILRRRALGWPAELKGRPAPAPPRTATCVICGSDFETRQARKKFCGKTCSREHSREYSRLYMNANYERFKDRVLVASYRRRMKFKKKFVEDVSLAALYERDKGRCGICRKRVPPLKSIRGKRDPKMASIDHMVPISQGGEHSYANTRLTHYRCNISRGNRGGNEQLALIG